MSQITPVFKREFFGYFRSPVAYVVLIGFILATVGCAFFLGNFFKANLASLDSYFLFLPWLFILLVPAVGMRLWAEEKRTGTIELLFTLPITTLEAVLGKFLAAWTFAGIALLLTFPIWITVNYLGDPDNGAILAAYLGSWLMAGGFLAIGACLSAATRNQVIAFITTALVCFFFLLAGFPVVLDFLRGVLPQAIVEGIAALSFFTHFDAISKGVIDLRDLIYFASLIGFWLAASALVLDMKKAD